MRRILIITGFLVVAAGLFAVPARSQQQKQKPRRKPSRLKTGVLGRMLGLKTVPNPDLLMRPVHVPDRPAQQVRTSPSGRIPSAQSVGTPQPRTNFNRPVVIAPRRVGGEVPRPEPVITGSTSTDPFDWDLHSWPGPPAAAVRITEPEFRYVVEGPRTRPLGDVFVDRPIYRMPNPFSSDLDSVLNPKSPIACHPKMTQPAFVQGDVEGPMETSPESVFRETPDPAPLLIPPSLTEPEETLALTVPPPAATVEEPLHLIEQAPEESAEKAQPSKTSELPAITVSQRQEVPREESDALKGADEVIVFAESDSLGDPVSGDHITAQDFVPSGKLTDAPLFDRSDVTATNSARAGAVAKNNGVTFNSDDVPTMFRTPDVAVPLIRAGKSEGPLPAIRPTRAGVSVAAALGKAPTTKPLVHHETPPRAGGSMLPPLAYEKTGSATEPGQETTMAGNAATEQSVRPETFLPPRRPGQPKLAPANVIEPAEPSVTAAAIRNANWRRSQMQNGTPTRSVSRERVIAGFADQIRTVSDSGSTNKPAGEVVPSQPVRRPMTRLERKRAIAARSDQVGLKGFCPVELRDNRQLIDSNPGISTVVGTRTYYFSSSEAKQRFLRDPHRYAPAVDGLDVVLQAQLGERLPGRLDYATWYRNRLYLFASERSMDLFNAKPGLYVKRK